MLVVWGAGCGGTSEPAPLERDHAESSPRPTVSPATQPTASPTPSTTTATPTSSLEQQLYAATVNFYEAINEAFRTLDTRPVAEVLVPGSRAASGYTNFIERVKADGHRFADVGDYVISDFTVRSDASGETERVEFNLAHPAGRIVDAQGRTVRTLPATSSKAWIDFQRRGDRWLVLSQHVDE